MRRGPISLLALLTLTVLFTSVTIRAQTNDNARQTSPGTAVKEKTAAEVEAERRLAERQVQAQSLLISLATDTTAYTDQRLRATNLMPIADLLWDSDHQ